MRSSRLRPIAALLVAALVAHGCSTHHAWTPHAAWDGAARARVAPHPLGVAVSSCRLNATTAGFEAVVVPAAELVRTLAQAGLFERQDAVDGVPLQTDRLPGLRDAGYQAALLCDGSFGANTGDATSRIEGHSWSPVLLLIPGINLLVIASYLVYGVERAGRSVAPSWQASVSTEVTVVETASGTTLWSGRQAGFSREGRDTPAAALDDALGWNLQQLVNGLAAATLRGE